MKCEEEVSSWFRTNWSLQISGVTGGILQKLLKVNHVMVFVLAF